MEMPAQAVLQAAAFGHQVVAVADQQAQVTRGTLELGGRVIGLAKGGAGNGGRVDRIRLAAFPSTAALTGHAAGRHPHNLLAGS
jgi:hypothetical protein